MKKNQNTWWKKTARISTLFLMVAALVVGIVFSNLKTHDSLQFGPEFNGAFQAEVQVITKDENNKVSDRDIAKGLTAKLSPLGDVPVTVSYSGKNHLSVISGRSTYNNSEKLFKSAIETSGGVFMLTKDQQSNEFQDLFTNADALKVLNADTRIQASDLFTNRLSVESLAKTSGRAPYVSLGLKKEGEDSFVFSRLVSEMNNKINNGEYYFITDFEALISQLINLYSLNSGSKDDLVEKYWNQVIKVAQEYINDDKTEYQTKQILRDVFSGEISWRVEGTGTGFPRSANISLLDRDFGSNITPRFQGREIRGIESADDLKLVLDEKIFNFQPNNQRSLDYFMYSSGATKEDFNSEAYRNNRTSSLTGDDLGSIQNTFKVIINFFLNNIINRSESTASINTYASANNFSINKELLAIFPSIEDYFVFSGQIFLNDKKAATIPQLTATNLGFTTVEIQNGNSNTLASGLYLPTTKLTSGRKAVASIRQNALGVSYRVETIITLPATISNVLFKVSVGFLIAISVLLAIYLLFVYRLLGLYTIIIAVTTASLTLLFASLFGIAFGPQVIMALFLVIGLTLDISLILFDAIIDKMYDQKQALKTAFKIGNKETIGITIDAIIVALIPNVTMFWVANGDLKNFATIATIGIAVALVLGVGFLRLGTWLILKMQGRQTQQWLLPISTNYDFSLSIKQQYLVQKYTLFLEKADAKTKFSSKELLQIKQNNEKLVAANTKLDEQRQENERKLAIKDQRQAEKLVKQLAKFEAKKLKYQTKHPKQNFVNNKVIEHYNLKIIELKNILSSETLLNVEEANKSSVSKNVRTLKTEHYFNRVGAFLALGIILFSLLGVILGFTIGPNLTANFGKGQQFVVYGERIADTYDNTIGNNRPSDWNPRLNQKAQQIANQYEEKMSDAIQQRDNAQTNGERINAQKYIRILQADQLKEFYSFVINENLYIQINSHATDIDLRNWSIKVLDDYSFVNEKNGVVSNNPINQVAIAITSTGVDSLSRTNFRRTLVQLSNPTSFPWNEVNEPHRGPEGGIIAYDQSPYTTTQLIKQILIVFGIMLLALLIYIIIRFKWTYYVALIIGIVLTFLGVVASVVVFRIPVSLELLSGFALLISFVTTSMLIVLGKGKSLLTFDNKNELLSKFKPEIEKSVAIRNKKRILDDEVAKQKQELKKVKSKLKKLLKQEKKGEVISEKKKLDLELTVKELQVSLKTLKKNNRHEYRQFKNTKKMEIRRLSKNNFFFKEIYMKLIHFSYRRMLGIGLIYTIVSIVLLTTLAPMFGMGLILLIGIILGAAVTLFIVIPIWILLERHRIRDNAGFKNYMNNIHVSQEEQIVPGIND